MNDNSNITGPREIFDSVKSLVGLQLDYARLTAAEKMTVLMSTVAFYALLTIVGSLVLIFLSVGVGHLLATTVARVAAYLYVAGFYLVLLILLFVFRKKLFVDPISRFVTRLMVEPPKE